MTPTDGFSIRLLNKFALEIILSLSVLPSVFSHNLCLAEAQSPSIADSVVLLVSEKEKTCATGFFTTAGELISSAHLVRSVCPQGNCSDLKLYSAPAADQPGRQELALGEISVARVLAGIDLASLKTSIFKAGVFSLTDSPVAMDNLHVAGFPRCGLLAVKNAKILRSDSLRYYLDATGSKGSSGSVLYSESFQVLGLVDEASGISSAFKSDFKLRTLRADNFLDLLRADEDSALRRELSLLLSYYKQDVTSKERWGRIGASLDFLAAASAAFLNYADKDLSLNSLYILSRRFDYPQVNNRKLKFPLTEFEAKLEALSLANKFEEHGPFERIFRALHSEKLLKEIQDSPRTPQQKEELVEVSSSFIKSQFRGINFTIFLWGLRFVGAGIALWALSLVFAVVLGLRLQRRN